MEELLTNAPISGDSWRVGAEQAGKVGSWLSILVGTFNIEHMPPSVWHSCMSHRPQSSHRQIGENNKDLVQHIQRLVGEINANRDRDGADQAAYNALGRVADPCKLINDTRSLVQQLARIED